MDTPQQDDQLWRLARKRAAFKKSLFVYFVINAFLWGIWWLTMGRHIITGAYPWPVWVMLGWGIGLAFQYYGAYGQSKEDVTSQEYEKLKKDQENQ